MTAQNSGLTLLSILFIALKLMGYIDWSWWWVLAPIWVIPALVTILLVIAWMVKK